MTVRLPAFEARKRPAADPIAKSRHARPNGRPGPFYNVPTTIPARSNGR
jgi:hypothetical protein